MERGRTIRGEELGVFLKSINRLGYPPRPSPVPLAGRDWPQVLSMLSSSSRTPGYPGLGRLATLLLTGGRYSP
jgi:hypothetical protein